MASLAAIPRRYVYLCIAAVVSLILLYQSYDFGSYSRSVVPATPYHAPTRVEDGKFHWGDLEVHFPVANLTSLPKGRPRKLPSIQSSFGKETVSERAVREERLQEVKAEFIKSWRSYREKAWLYDELSPISGNGRNSFGGWAATLVDALDTLWIMDLKEDFDEAVRAVASIDFSTSTEETVNVFETTIRYLGGFLAAYDLSNNKILLDKAVEIGEMLLVAFDTPNRMPVTRWDWRKAASGARQEASSSMLVSELGSLSLEFTHLTQVTGDPRWYDAIQRITEVFDVQQDKTKLSGMWPVVINARDKDMTSDTGFTLGGMSDSLYEYFPKEYALLGGLSEVYQKLYQGSMTTAIKHLFFRPMTPGNLDILISGDARASNDGQSSTLEPRGQHLGCFAGGMLGIGGRLFSNAEHVSIGKKLTDGCIWAYKAMLHGVMPEIAHFVPCPSPENCAWDRSVWLAAVMERAGQDMVNSNVEDIVRDRVLPEGYTSIDDKRYILRPEAIESVFIMYRITGDNLYRESAWEMFTAIRRISSTKFANAAVVDITTIAADGLPPKDDRMESFWLAETLKYFYLIFSKPEVISLDDYVLNTEAHPFRRPN